MFIDIGERGGRGRALALLAEGQVGVLVVPSLMQLMRSAGELVDIVERYFSATERAAELVAVADGIDTRTRRGRLALAILCSVARFEKGSVVHA